jgi:TRAP transporter TAXI family solute receptor
MRLYVPRLLRQLLLATTLIAGATAGHAAEFINVLTGGTSGVYYPLGVALTQIYGKAMPDAKVVGAGDQGLRREPQPAAGRPRRDRLHPRRRLNEAWKGDEEAGFKTPLKKLRGVAAIYPNYIQIVAAADSGIRTLADLKGKRISVGAPKSGTELNARAVLKARRTELQGFRKVEYLPFGESVELMKNRQLDVTLQSAGLGVAALRDLATAVPIVIVSRSRPRSSPRSAIRPTRPGVIPAEDLRGPDRRRSPTVAIQNFLVTHDGVSTDTVYNMTKSMFDNLDQMVAAHAAAKAIDKKEDGRRHAAAAAPRRRKVLPRSRPRSSKRQPPASIPRSHAHDARPLPEASEHRH